MKDDCQTISDCRKAVERLRKIEAELLSMKCSGLFRESWNVAATERLLGSIYSRIGSFMNQAGRLALKESPAWNEKGDVPNDGSAERDRPRPRC